MAFLIQPVADLIVPLAHIARGTDQKTRQEATEKFIQAACRTSLACVCFFVAYAADKAINANIEPYSRNNLIGRLLALTLIYFPCGIMHPYAVILSRVLHHTFIGIRANKPADMKAFSQCLDIGAAVVGLYVASRLKTLLHSSKLDQQIVHLSQNLASYIFETRR